MRIRRARERKRWTQRRLAEEVGVSRTTVDAWENGRSYPRNRIGALEEVLGIDLTARPAPAPRTDDVERQIWALDGPEDERLSFIEHLREGRARDGEPPDEEDTGG